MPRGDSLGYLLLHFQDELVTPQLRFSWPRTLDINTSYSNVLAHKRKLQIIVFVFIYRIKNSTAAQLLTGEAQGES